MNANTTPATRAARAPRVRWRIFALIFGLGFAAYMQQKTLTVTGMSMMPQLHLNQLQIAWLESAWVVGYTVLQFPGGLIGEWLGARRTLILISLIAVGAALVVPVAPYALAGTALFVVLLGAQFTLGAAQGPLNPVSAGVFAEWFPARQWPIVNGVQSMGLSLGGALTPPLIASLMLAVGWQRAVIWSTLPALALVALWAWYGRDSPRAHPRVSSSELAELADQTHEAVVQRVTWSRVLDVLANRDVLLLTVSYMCMNYVFYLIGNWCFFYLVQERHFSILESGWLTSLPNIAAALGAGVGGYGATYLCVRLGVKLGLRLLPIAALLASAVLLTGAVYVANAYVAVAALALCFACVELTEGCFWAATMQVAQADTMVATGILNTGGNAGGLIAIPVVGYLSGHRAWTAALLLGVAFAVLSALLWIGIDATRRLGRNEPSGARA